MEQSTYQRHIYLFIAAAFYAIALLAISPPGSLAATPTESAQADSDTAFSAVQSIVDVGDSTRLQRVFDKARHGQLITVGFLGGSITQGFAAKDEAHRYTDLVTTWWREQFPQSKITEINAGIGATGSNYGALRVQRDLLQHNPDFVVVEFAVNDMDVKESAVSLEGAVRQILSSPGSPACMLLFMSNSGLNAQKWHALIGKHYGLPMVSYRDGLAAEINAGHLEWEDVSQDVIHPNSRGHAMAARYVIRMLNTELAADRQASAKAGEERQLPPPLFSDAYEHVALKEAAALQPTLADGWKYDAQNTCWSADQPGSVLEFKVMGTGVVLMYYRIHKDMGEASVTVDGSNKQTLDGWFAQTWGGYRNTEEIATGLTQGEHTVRIEVLKESSPASRGHEFHVLGVAAIGTAPATKPSAADSGSR